MDLNNLVKVAAANKKKNVVKEQPDLKLMFDKNGHYFMFSDKLMNDFFKDKGLIIYHVTDNKQYVAVAEEENSNILRGSKGGSSKSAKVKSNVLLENLIEIGIAEENNKSEYSFVKQGTYEDGVVYEVVLKTNEEEKEEVNETITVEEEQEESEPSTDFLETESETNFL